MEPLQEAITLIQTLKETIESLRTLLMLSRHLLHYIFMVGRPMVVNSFDDWDCWVAAAECIRPMAASCPEARALVEDLDRIQQKVWRNATYTGSRMAALNRTIAKVSDMLRDYSSEAVAGGAAQTSRARARARPY
jgi:hypothetical protein